MTRLGQRAGRVPLWAVIPLILSMILITPAQARQYAAMVMDARTGEVLHSRNADTRLHPASLTKMMTLYVAFEAIERGEITLDTKVRVSKSAAAEPASKLYLKAGSSIELRYLIRASAVKSANDAAHVIAEAISGSVPKFARRMNKTAKALGMKNTTFKNPHGLTQSGHLSTARDMTILGRHVFYDYPEYYNLFSRRTTNAKVTTVANTNRRLLNSYRGADGIKTGYTNAAGSNLVASAERGNVRIIATMFGGSSSAARNKRVAELLDMGFSRAPKHASVRKPSRPNYAVANARTAPKFKLTKSAIPAARPATILARAAAARDAAIQMAANTNAAPNNPALETLDAIEADDAVLAALAEGQSDAATPPNPETALVVATLKDGQMRPVPRATARVEQETDNIQASDAETPEGGVTIAALAPDTATESEVASSDATPDTGADIQLATATTQSDTSSITSTDVTMRRGVEETLAGLAPARADETAALTVAAAVIKVPDVARPAPRPARVTYSTSDMTVPLTEVTTTPVMVSTRSGGGSNWGVQVGRYNTRWQAERVMLQTALQQVDLLSNARREVVSKSTGFEVQFVGLSKQEATQTCQRLTARDERCAPFGS